MFVDLLTMCAVFFMASGGAVGTRPGRLGLDQLGCPGEWQIHDPLSVF